MKILLALTILAFSFISLAGEANDDEYCTSIYDLAEAIMQARQSGNVSVTDMVKATKGNKFGKTLVIAAYGIPMYSLPKNKKEATKEFATRVYLECANLQSL